jgi:hypothetical protein
MNYILHHLGLGDHISCNGMVRELKKQYGKITLFCKEKNYQNVSYMFRDDKEIYIIPFEEKEPDYSSKETIVFKILNYMNAKEGNKIIIGYDKVWQYRNTSPDEAFYKIANMDYNIKYSKFFYERNLEEEERIFNKLNPDNQKYIFIHDDEERGFKINVNTNYKIIKNDKQENIFNMLKILINAEEIHCMHSSFFCLVDCLAEKINFKNLYLHQNIRNVEIYENSISKKWIKI